MIPAVPSLQIAAFCGSGSGPWESGPDASCHAVFPGFERFSRDADFAAQAVDVAFSRPGWPMPSARSPSARTTEAWAGPRSPGLTLQTTLGREDGCPAGTAAAGCEAHADRSVAGEQVGRCPSRVPTGQRLVRKSATVLICWVVSLPLKEGINPLPQVTRWMTRSRGGLAVSRFGP